MVADEEGVGMLESASVSVSSPASPRSRSLSGQRV